MPDNIKTTPPAGGRWLAFKDLAARGIVSNRVTLSRWIKLRGFPVGVMLGENSRRWREDEINAWIAAQPAYCEGAGPGKRTAADRPAA